MVGTEDDRSLRRMLDECYDHKSFPWIPNGFGRMAQIGQKSSGCMMLMRKSRCPEMRRKGEKGHETWHQVLRIFWAEKGALS
jgi:hypothetical protein